MTITEILNDFVLTNGAITLQDVNNLLSTDQDIKQQQINELVLTPFTFLFLETPRIEITEQEIANTFVPDFCFYTFNAPMWTSIETKTDELTIQANICINSGVPNDIVDDILEVVACSIEMNMLDNKHGIPHIQSKQSLKLSDLHNGTLSFNSASALKSGIASPVTGEVDRSSFDFSIYINEFLEDDIFLYYPPSSYAIRITVNSIVCDTELRQNDSQLDKFLTYSVSFKVTMYSNAESVPIKYYGVLTNR